MPIRKLTLVLFLLVCAHSVQAQNLVTSNAFVSASVQPSRGWVDISAGGQSLSYGNHSYLSLIIDGKYYTSNNAAPSKITQTIGGTAQTRYPDVTLLGATSTKRGDTIITVWNEGTFDIQQRVYPVAFRASGQIVISVRIVNHDGIQLAIGGAQWLCDLKAGSNDAPAVIERYAYDGSVTRIPAVGTSSLYIAMQNGPGSLGGGAIGAGFTNDSFPPAKMGLTRIQGAAIVDWAHASEFTYGIDAVGTGSAVLDNACLLQWGGKTAPGASLKDSTTTEIFRTSYGTQEFCLCLGQAIAINIYPTWQRYSFASRTYTPNPLPVLSLVFNTQNSAITNVAMTQNVVSPMQILTGGIVSSSGTSATYNIASIPPGGMQDFVWADYTADGAGGTYPIDFHLSASGYSGGWNCTQPTSQSGCGVKVDTSLLLLTGAPTKHLISRTGSDDASTCNARVTTMRVYDTGTRHSTVSVVADSVKNMRVLIPSTKQPTDTLEYQVQVIDSMFDGFATVSIHDTIGGLIRDTVRYCTIADTHAPTIHIPTDWPLMGDSIVVTDDEPWDRGVAFVVISDAKLDQVDTVLISAPSPRVTILNTAPPPYTRKQICILALDGAGNTTDTCFAIGNDQSVLASAPEGLSITPNPSSDHITIRLTDGATRRVTLWNLLGQTVAQMSVQGSADLEISTLPEGTYILRVGDVMQRVIKTR